MQLSRASRRRVFEQFSQYAIRRKILEIIFNGRKNEIVFDSTFASHKFHRKEMKVGQPSNLSPADRKEYLKQRVLDTLKHTLNERRKRKSSFSVIQFKTFRYRKANETIPATTRSLYETVTGLLLLVHLLLGYLLLPKLPLGHLLLGTICYCVIIATIIHMLLRTPKFVKAIHDHNQFKQLRN